MLARVLCLWLPQDSKKVLNLPEPQKGLAEEWKGLEDCRYWDRVKDHRRFRTSIVLGSDKVDQKLSTPRLLVDRPWP